MSSYPFEEFTRVVLVPSIANLAAPTLDEIDAGIDITCDLTKDGLAVGRTTEGIERARWPSLLIGEDPGRYSFDQPTLKGKRRTQDDVEPFYDACIYRGSSFLVVRRGLPYEHYFDGGQVVEAVSFRFGHRTTAPSAANTTVTFTVRLFVNADNDAAVLTGHSLLTEDGLPLLTEDGHLLLVEP